ncbi:guanylate kinase [Acetobacteraceae bacterium]|nr:guanylate kinase [Acetobacteraceae bacterium]
MAERDFTQMKRRGLCLVVAAPSGTGKSTICKSLLSNNTDITLSISATTRQPRPGEIDGRDYHFYEKEQFEGLIENDGFIEWAKVYDNYYGTPRAPLEKSLKEGKDILLDLDWQGFRQLKALFPKDVVGLFLLPPSLEALETRLRNRSSDKEEVIQSRMEKAASEISHWPEFDYLVVNDDLEQAEKEVGKILRANRFAVNRFRDAF